MLPTQRSCDVESLADFSRYYATSWVGHHPKDKNCIDPCYVGGMLTEKHVQLRPLRKQDDGKFIVEGGFPLTWDELQEQVDFGIPDIGMQPDGPTFVFCSYTTPRHAKKGYRSREVQESDFNKWEIRKKYIPANVREKYDWVWHAFNPEYSTFEKAEEKLRNGEAVGIPLSRTLGIYSSPSSKNSLLAYKRWTVGHIVSPELIHLKREYGDYEGDIVRQTGVEVIVG